jgi:tRNA(adenine34) deaminase
MPDPNPSPAIVDLVSDQFFMGEALRQARRAYDADEVPVGAVIVREGRVIARAFNQVELLKDATAHAEMLALTQAQAAVGDWRLTDCTLYVTKEPCPMCAGAVVHTRLRRVVFGAPDPKGGAAGSALNLLDFPTLNHRCIVTQGVCLDECRALLLDFFREQRRKPAGPGPLPPSDNGHLPG